MCSIFGTDFSSLLRFSINHSQKEWELIRTEIGNKSDSNFLMLLTIREVSKLPSLDHHNLKHLQGSKKCMIPLHDQQIIDKINGYSKMLGISYSSLLRMLTTDVIIRKKLLGLQEEAFDFQDLIVPSST